MIACNELIDEVCQYLNVVGDDESTDDNLSEKALYELNRLIGNLNSEGFIASSQKYVDIPGGKVVYIKKLAEGEELPANTVDMEPPEKVEGVSRKIGGRFLPLTPMDLGQMNALNRECLAETWNYGKSFETVEGPGEPGEQRIVGKLEFSGFAPEGYRMFYTEKLPKFKLSDTIYLSDLYNNLIFSGLKYAMAKRQKLDAETKADAYTDFIEAKTLIKRNNLPQRMIQSGPLAGSYMDAYADGIAGNGF